MKSREPNLLRPASGVKPARGRNSTGREPLSAWVGIKALIEWSGTPGHRRRRPPSDHSASLRQCSTVFAAARGQNQFAARSRETCYPCHWSQAILADVLCTRTARRAARKSTQVIFRYMCVLSAPTGCSPATIDSDRLKPASELYGSTHQCKPGLDRRKGSSLPAVATP